MRSHFVITPTDPTRVARPLRTAQLGGRVRMPLRCTRAPSLKTITAVMVASRPVPSAIRLSSCLPAYVPPCRTCRHQHRLIASYPADDPPPGPWPSARASSTSRTSACLIRPAADTRKASGHACFADCGTGSELALGAFTADLDRLCAVFGQTKMAESLCRDRGRRVHPPEG